MKKPSLDRRLRLDFLYVALPPLLAVAAIILGRYTWQTASSYAELGQAAIVESTLVLANESVTRIENGIIRADNAVLSAVDLDDLDALDARWRYRAEELSPSIRAVLVAEDDGEVRAFSIRGDDRDKWAFLYLFRERVRGDLELRTLPEGRLKHLHKTYGSQSYLFSVQCVVHEGRRLHVVMHHDTGFIVREQIAGLFSTAEVQQQYNVIDVDTNRVVHGKDLSHAGNFLVGIRFPTTLYAWRLQVAPTRAGELGARVESQRRIETVLIVSSFAVLFFGMISLLVASYNERQLSNLKSEFIANVSHELKTPLSVVRMFGEMLLTNRVKSDAKRQQYLEIIVRESERLSALIENVLDFSRLERGKREYELRVDDPVAVVSRAVETFRYRVEHEGIKVTFEADDDVPTLALDAQSIVLAVINLLDNAVKYGGATPVTVSVRKLPRWVEIAVRDRGPGIPDEDLRRVFDRFFRTERDRGTRGSGIGLSLVKHIAEAHGGRAVASNHPDGGAIVAFTLSLGTQASAPVRASLPPPPADLSAPGGG